MDKRKKIQPSEKCPRCNAWVHPQDLAANNGVCVHCYPAAGFVVGVYEPKKEVKRG